MYESLIKSTREEMAIRKTRFVCISDTHNAGGAFHIPKGDVLIHAGDLTNQGTYSELQKAITWLQGIDGFQSKIVIAGMSLFRVLPCSPLC
jgi:3',5'-cyclic AMP phosphodiesterase CpdA